MRPCGVAVFAGRQASADPGFGQLDRPAHAVDDGQAQHLRKALAQRGQSRAAQHQCATAVRLDDLFGAGPKGGKAKSMD